MHDNLLFQIQRKILWFAHDIINLTTSADITRQSNRKNSYPFTGKF